MKSAIKKQLGNKYIDYLANLISDRKFTKIPLKVRFDPSQFSNMHNEKPIFELIGNIRISRKELCKDFLVTLFLIANLIFSVIFNNSKREKLNKNISFIYSLTPEQILSNGKIDSFLHFLAEPRFASLFYQRITVIECKSLQFWRQRRYENLRITLDNSLWITRNMLSRRTVLRIFCESMSIFRVILFQKNSDFQFALREIFFDQPVWRHYLQHASQTNVITTQSQFLKLPFVFYTPADELISKSMLWYSTNSKPIQNRNTLAKFDAEHFRLKNIHHHYVWTENNKLNLMDYNPGASIKSVGSILFRAKFNILEQDTSFEDGILIFDVTPFNGLDVKVFYNLQILTDFINDIIEVLNECDCKKNVYLKQKRDYSRKVPKAISPNSQYLNLIEKLQQDKRLRVLDPHANLYTIIKQAFLVIGIPFTSPVMVAKEMKVKTIYYVPDSAKDWLIDSVEDGVSVIHGKKNLLEFMQQTLR